MLYVVTYATHSHGMFEDLINNNLKVPVKVLGWGKKWNGFTDKFEGVLEYANKLNPDDILVFVDGFDSKILKGLDEIHKRFKDMDCGLLLSKDVEFRFKIYKTDIFGECKKGITANSGLYMGYVKHVKQVLKDSLKMSCKDDQVNINSICKKYDFIKIDENKRIFKNISNYDSSIEDACIVQHPGEVSIKRRLIRGIPEYSQFLIEKIFVVIITLAIIFPKFQNKLLILLILFGIFFVGFCEKSCIKNRTN